MIDEIPVEPTPEAAAYLDEKAGASLFEKVLEPWSPSRVVAANAMGLVWPMPPEAADQLRTNGIFAGALSLTIIVCWLRSIPNASEQDKEATMRREWNVQRANQAPRAAFEAATAWGAERKITDLTDDDAAPFLQAYKVALATLLNVSVSEFNVQAPPNTKPEAGGAPPNV
jgi:hypothetical protein